MGMNRNKDLLKELSACLLLAAAFCLLCVFLNRSCDRLINADAASELVMGKCLAEEGRLLSENFHYSTELRVFDSNLIWMPLFRVMSNWHAVRVVGSILSYILMIGCLYALCAAAGLRKEFPFLATVWLLPFSWGYFFNVLNCMFYTLPHAAIAAALALLFAELSDRRALRKAALAGGVLLAFLCGLNSVRMAITLYLPLALAILLAIGLNPSLSREGGRLLRSSALLLAATLVGWLINFKLLSARYSYATYDEIWFVPFDIARLEAAVNAWLYNLGYQEGPAFSSALVFCAEAGALAVLSLYSVIVIIRRREAFSLPRQVTAYFFLFSLLLVLLIFALTNMQLSDRYMLTAAAFAFFPIFICFSNRGVFVREGCGRWVLLGLMLLCCAASLLQYRAIARIDYTAANRETADFLVSAGYRSGYATFWNANLTTELSDGKIEFWSWRDGVVMGPDTVYPWLQKASHDTEHPEGKVCMVLSEYEAQNNRERLKGFSEEDIVFRSTQEVENVGHLLVWGFDSYEDFAAAFS